MTGVILPLAKISIVLSVYWKACDELKYLKLKSKQACFAGCAQTLPGATPLRQNPPIQKNRRNF